MFFRLAPDCFLVEGRGDGVLYDVSRLRIFLLDEAAHRLLRRCEENQPVSGEISEPEMRLLRTLCDEGLGFFDEQPSYVDKMLLNSPVEFKGLAMQPPHYQVADWEITDGCDLSCATCGLVETTYSWQVCQTCMRFDRHRSARPASMPVEQVVAELADLELSTVHLRGGNPLLEWEQLIRIVEAALRTSRLKVIITTPGTGQPLERILSLYQHGPVYLNVVMWGTSPATYTAVHGRPDVLATQLELVDRLVGAGHPFYLTFLLTEATRETRHEIEAFARERWNGTPSFAEVYRRELLPEGARFTHVREDGKPLSPWRSREDFYFRIKSNTCLYGRFELGVDGRVRPCPGIDQVCGEVTGALGSALALPDLYTFWELDKGGVEPCKGCALRMACADCTVAERNAAGDPRGKAMMCPYDPNGAVRAFRWRWDPPGFVKTLTVQEVARS